MTSSINLAPEEIAELSRKALMANGATEFQAASVAAAIAAAEVDGIRSHGLQYLPIFCEHLRVRKVIGDAVPVVRRAAPGVVKVDAKSGFAHPAIEQGIPVLEQAARENGVAVLAIHNSYNCGVLAYHTERIANSGLVALGFTNAPASIAPWGARKPVLGTNPFSLAVPAKEGGVQFVIDQSSSVIAKSEVVARKNRNESIPEGWVFDANGKPTTDPALGLQGSMVPSGGYKGVGIALLVEVMAACLTGATPGINAAPFAGPNGGPPRTGQLFIAIDPAATSGDEFFDRIHIVIDAYVAEPGTRLPGDKRKRSRLASATVRVAPEAYAAAIKLSEESQGERHDAG